MNPEKDLIKTSSNAIRPNMPTFLPPSPEPQPPVLPPLQEVEPLESGTHRLYSLSISHDDTYLISVISQIYFLAIAPVILCQYMHKRNNCANFKFAEPKSGIFVQKPIDSLLDTAAGDDGIPCQFCDKAFPLHEIERHQKSCPVRFAPHNLETDIGHFAMRSGPGGASSLTENKAECTYCRKLVPFSKLSTHEEVHNPPLSFFLSLFLTLSQSLTPSLSLLS